MVPVTSRNLYELSFSVGFPRSSVRTEVTGCRVVQVVVISRRHGLRDTGFPPGSGAHVCPGSSVGVQGEGSVDRREDGILFSLSVRVTRVSGVSPDLLPRLPSGSAPSRPWDPLLRRQNSKTLLSIDSPSIWGHTPNPRVPTPRYSPDTRGWVVTPEVHVTSPTSPRSVRDEDSGSE